MGAPPLVLILALVHVKEEDQDQHPEKKERSNMTQPAFLIDARKQWEGASFARPTRAGGAVVGREGNVTRARFGAPAANAALAAPAAAGARVGRDSACYPGTQDDDCHDMELIAALQSYRGGQAAAYGPPDEQTAKLAQLLQRRMLSPGWDRPADQKGQAAFTQITSNTGSPLTTIANGIITLAGSDQAIISLRPNRALRIHALVVSVFAGANNLLAIGDFRQGGIEIFPNSALMTADAYGPNVLCRAPFDVGPVPAQVPIDALVQNLVPQATQFSVQAIVTYYNAGSCR